MADYKWPEIIAARETLKLGKRATLGEIKKSYRKLSKKCHPDLTKDSNKDAASKKMQEITAAYQLLLDYCANYTFPLEKTTASEPLDDNEWWMDRFGNDPLWSKKRD
ncbi:MAG: DnaJ domain-containing protein [Proteobacteria bacterium]|nr:DnaJ domain-containing protein [Pseudomonadota bacterium]MBU1716460.1 DnaJ domain-containing protein [Pseudomonadota bacterium]